MSIPRGSCCWCLCERSRHDGAVDPAVVADPANKNVKWTRTACSTKGCTCRRYWAGGER